MNREQREEIRARAEAATEGPWFTGGAGRWPSLKPHELIVSPKYPLMEFEDTEQGRADAKFVAAARTDVPALLDEIDRLTRERDDAIEEGNALARIVAALVGPAEIPLPGATTAEGGTSKGSEVS